MTKRLILMLTIFALTACSAPAVAPTVAIIPTTAAASEPPPATNTLEPPTALPTATIEPTPDFDATATAITEAVMTAVEPTVFSSYPSPDGKWRVDVIRYDCVSVDPTASDTNAFEQVKLIDIATEAETILDTQLQYCGGLGAFGLDGLYWSSNSQYFYYTNAREGQPDGCGYWERPINRYDTASEEILPMGAGPLSPDEAMLATWQENDLVVWSLDEGEIARAEAVAPALEKGQIAWSPDSQSLVYVQIKSYCPPSGMSQVVRLDLPDLTSTALIETDTPSFAFVEWTTANKLRLITHFGGAGWMPENDICLSEQQSEAWIYSFVTGELSCES
jgi:hypothetical protein